MSDKQAEDEYYWHILMEFKAMIMYFGADKIMDDLELVKFGPDGPFVDNPPPEIIVE